MKKFGDKTESGRYTTDSSAIKFVKKYITGWRRVDNLGDNGIRVKLGDCSILLISMENVMRINKL